MGSLKSERQPSRGVRGENSAWPWNVGMLPFYYAPLASPTNGDLPDDLPFTLDIDRTTGTLVQVPSELVKNSLSQAYLKGTMITGMLDEEGIGKEYAEDFLAYVKRSLNRSRFEDIRVLEVGCGLGYLLYRLKQSGATVLGLEPGAHGQEGSRRFNVDVIRDFFPSAKISGKFDLIILYGVLEHAQFSSDFLANVKAHLKPDGRVILSVPDCQPYLSVGDISMLFCEHWSYFTERTLRNSIDYAMRTELQIEKSSFGGSLYATTGQAIPGPIVRNFDIKRELKEIRNYRNHAEKGLTTLFRYLERATSSGKSLGIYVPSRAINALSLLRGKIDMSRIRFFDDNRSLHGTYFPGFNIPVEDRKRLVANPPDSILVMSHAFGAKIRDELATPIDEKSEITIWEDLFKV